MTEQLDLEDWLRENPKSLTEQWKKGELEDGFYYINIDDGEFQFYDVAEFNGDCFGFYPNEDIKEVLAPVPSYEEWQAKKEENKNLYKMLDVLTGHLNSLLKEDKENQQLKELLRECRDFIDFCTAKCFGLDKEKMITKIDNAIGEKK